MKTVDVFCHFRYVVRAAINELRRVQNANHFHDNALGDSLILS